MHIMLLKIVTGLSLKVENICFKYAQRLNQWKGAHVHGQPNTRERGYNSFFCYTKQAHVGGWSDISLLNHDTC